MDKGELLVITGPSGIGKSTLLHWLLGNKPQHVLIKGQVCFRARILLISLLNKDVLGY